MKRSIALVAIAGLTACGESTTDFTQPPATPTLDQQVRQSIASWGVVPMLAVKAQDPALVDLAPTALRLFGIDPPSYMDGRPLAGLV